MPDLEILKGKRILAVDDEPDVLEVIREELPDCRVDTARNYETAKALITSETYDLVVLDIMGVNGFALLELARERRLPSAMLTAHAVTTESINRSLRLGAVSFLPKDELANLPELLAEIFDSLAKGQSHWKMLFQRLGPFFKERLDLEKPRHPPYSW
jgi:DNA-binding response OmpR family regulator